jgi:hypothetical protein
MATLTVSSGDYMRPYRGPVRCKNAPEAVSQSFKLGYPLIPGTTSGKEDEVKIAGTDPTTGILGVAAGAASGTETTNITFWLAEPEVEFLARVQDTGSAVRTDVGKTYGIVLDATNLIWRVDLTETTNVNVVITEVLNQPGLSVPGDTNNLVAFQWKASARTPFAG